MENSRQAVSKHFTSLLLIFALLVAAQWVNEIKRFSINALSGSNFMVATIKVIPPTEEDPLRIEYWASAQRPTDAIWTAILFREDWTRIATRKGLGGYSENLAGPRKWYWSAFFKGFSENPPEVPNYPFRICTWYRTTDVETGLRRDTEQFCSPIYDPNNPYPDDTLP